jgi:DNA polymerase-3 subunit gamma/tau
VATALYRRYRPESFAEVIGQDHVTTPLRRALRAGRVGHAYLFSGPRGCGKTTSARILARCLNCEQGPTDTPCGTCDSCRDLARGGAGSLDVVEIDAASHGGVDDARELRERASFAPVRDRYKVFIIDEAHMVTSAGFNALLKLVEEPPDHVKFVFATTEPDKVIGTIRSRTHHYPFRLIPPQVLGPYLDEVCAAEGVQVGDGVMPLVVRAGGGSARDSMSVLDQLMAGAGEDGLDFPTAIALLGFTDTALLDQAVTAIAERDAAALYGAVEHVLATGHEPRRFVEDLLERMRDLIVLAAVPDRGADLLPQVPADELERMRAQSSQFAPADLSLCGDLTHETLSTMSGATSPRLHLELLAARLVLRDERASLSAADGPGPQGAGTSGAASAVRGGQERSGAPSATGGGGREEARRIAQERAEAARQARGGGRPAPAPVASAPSGGPAAPAAGPAVSGTANAPAATDASATSDAPQGVPAQGPQGVSAQNPPAQRPQGQDVQSSQEPSAARPGDGTTSGSSSASSQWGTSSGGDASWGGSAPQSGPAPQGESAPQVRPAPRSEPAPQNASAPQNEPAPQGAAAPQNEPAPQGAPAPQGGPAPQAGGLDAEAVRGHWSAILDELQQIRRPSWALISQNATVNGAHGTTLVLGFRTDGLVSAFHRGTAAENLADAVRRIMHTDITVEAVVGEGPGPGGGAPGPGAGPGGGAPGGGPGGRGPGGAAPGDAGPGGGAPGSGGPGGSRPGGMAPGNAAPGSSGPGGTPAERQAPRGGSAPWGDAASAMAPSAPSSAAAPVPAASPAPDAPASSTSPAPAAAPAPAASPAAAAAPTWGEVAAGGPASGSRSRADSEEQAPSVGQRASERAMAAAARAARNAPAAPSYAPADDFPPEPDDPYPPDPRDDEPPAPRDHGRPAPYDHGQPSSHEDGSSAPVHGGTAPTASPVPDAAPLEVEDEGRDALPAEEPRTFGQNALKRALAEGRVVRSLPAPLQQQGSASGGSVGEPAPGSDAPAASDPFGATPSGPDGTTAASPDSPASAETAGAGSAGPDGSASDPQGSATARAAASWGAAAAVTGTVPGQHAPAPSAPPASSAPSAPVASPAGPPPQAPRSGAALVREAAMASRTAGQRLRGARPEPDAAPEADLDPTGGATRDDEDAVVATRNGREVIEKMLGGKVLEVIDETGPR